MDNLLLFLVGVFEIRAGSLCALRILYEDLDVD